MHLIKDIMNSPPITEEQQADERLKMQCEVDIEKICPS